MKSAAIFTAIIAGLATSAKAQIDNADARTCPAQYELIGRTMCMKASNGDIVLPTAATAASRYTNANCGAGYEIVVGNQCMNIKTGDIVYADESPTNAMRKVEK